jgi:hypothetical protein
MILSSFHNPNEAGFTRVDRQSVFNGFVFSFALRFSILSRLPK